jgi:hypothetical protein
MVASAMASLGCAAEVCFPHRTFWELAQDTSELRAMPSTGRSRAFSDSVLFFDPLGAPSTAKEDDASSQSTVSAWCEDTDEDSTSVDPSVTSFPGDSADESPAPATPSGPPGTFVASSAAPFVPVRQSRRGRRGSRTEARAQASDKSTAETEEPERTTLLIKRLPDKCTRDLLCAMLDAAGFAGRYDFVYLPVNFKTSQPFQYGMVNFVSSNDALVALDSLNTTTPQWPQHLPAAAAVEAAWCTKSQGLRNQVELYRNSPVMHHSVPDVCKPILLRNGVRIPFPAPTARLLVSSGRRRGR